MKKKRGEGRGEEEGGNGKIFSGSLLNLMEFDREREREREFRSSCVCESKDGGKRG